MKDRPRFIAVLDVGKTNVKIVLHDVGEGRDLAVRTTPNIVRQDGPYPHFDTDAIAAFFLDGLADLRRERLEPIEGISITAHGGSGVLLGADALAMPVLDYEYAGPETLAEDYDRVRPTFSESCSPRLPGGLNVGAQFFWQERAFPEAFAKVRFIMTYPQYWAWWMTGVAVNEATSLGSHTDLWNPRAAAFSSMVDRLGWRSRMAPVRSAFDVLGPLRSDLARRLGFAADIPVACGLHDSNASLLPHIMGNQGPLSVVSTGTWVICFASGGSLDTLDPERDTLANVDAFARPVPSARFMGGREFEILAGKEPAKSDEAALGAVLQRRIFALPSFSPGNGPFPKGQGRWSHPVETLTPPERTTAASLYAALVSATSLGLLAAQGPTIVEGPFARNGLYLAALRRLTDRPVVGSKNATGTTGGAALLFRRTGRGSGEPFPVDEPDHGSVLGAEFDAYARGWCDAAARG